MAEFHSAALLSGSLYCALLLNVTVMPHCKYKNIDYCNFKDPLFIQSQKQRVLKNVCTEEMLHPAGLPLRPSGGLLDPGMPDQFANPSLSDIF